MRVSDFMTARVSTVTPDAGARDTYFRMRREGIRHLPVTDPERNLLGIISERDLRRPDWIDEAPDLTHPYSLDDSLEIGDLMTRNVITVHAHDTLRTANALFLQHRIGTLPVVDKTGKLVGMLSTRDLLRALGHYLEEAARKGHE